jgi:cyanate lyase
MTREQATALVLEAKRESGLTWAALAEAVGRSPVWTTTALMGQAAMGEEEAAAATAALGLGPEVAAVLTEPPYRHGLGETVPVDPLLYRFHEITQIYGLAIKALIHEEFGDGIMSAIDFRCTIERVPDPAGDRVRVVYDGKFLANRVF